MNKRRFLTFVLLVSLTLVSSPRAAQGSTVPLPVWSGAEASRVEGIHTQVQHSVEAATAPAFGRLPLSFVPNAGQTDPAVRFQVRSSVGTLFFTPGGVVLSLPTPVQAPGRGAQRAVPGGALDLNTGKPTGQHRDTSTVPPAPPTVLRLRFEGANPAPEVAGAERLSGIVNYFIGNDPAKWRTNLPTYAGVVYRELYPRIDLHYDGTEGTLKGTYIVAPGADPGRIRWRYDGAMNVHVDEGTGDLLIQLPAGAGAGGEGRTLTERSPVAWQSIDGQRVSVSVRYVIGSDGSIGFAVGDYDPAHPLTLDPTLIYSTFLGGSDLDDGYSIAVDSAGQAYVVGRTLSTDFPTTTLTLDGTFNSGYDVFVTKLNATGDTLLYGTYLGGSSSDESSDIAVDSAGNAYVTGYTRSSDFPTPNALYGTLNGVSDIFVAKLNAAGNALLYSTYLGGSDWEYSYGIAVDGTGNAYVAGSTGSDDFSIENALYGTLKGGSDATVTKLNAAGNALVYSTYLGGGSADAGYGGIAVDRAGNAYVTGYTTSTDFPTSTLMLYGTFSGGSDAFVTKLNEYGSALIYSTYLGGSSSERGLAIAVDGAGNVYITGYTQSGDFPKESPLDAVLGGTQDAFVTKINAAGSAVLYSTYLGGSGRDTGEGITVESNNTYLTGSTESDDFATASPLDDTLNGTADAFVAKLNEAGSALLYSSYLGGSDDDGGYSIAVDSAGDAYVTGWTESTDFPTQNPLQAGKAGPINCDPYDLSCVDAFVTKTDLGEGIPNWAFLLYLAGDNNLCGYMRRAIVNLESAVPNPNLTILALLDCPHYSTWRYHVQPGGNYTDGVNRWSMGELDMSDTLTLLDFIIWARDNYPAKHYYLAVADHGRGTTGIAWDDTSGSNEYISVAKLRTVLRSATDYGAEPLEVVHYDACLMGMLENAYQIQDYADYLVVSENEGWSVFAYDRYAAQVTADTTPKQLAMAVVDEYHNALTGYPRTISALDLGLAGVVEDAVTALATALQANLDANKYYVSNSRDAAQKFDSQDYYVIDLRDEYLDLYSFAQLIKQNIPDNTVKNAAQGVMDAVTAIVVAERHESGYYKDYPYWDLDDAHGVSIYFPPASGGWDYDPYMSHVLFRFTADGQWDEFLQAYFGVIGLPPETPVDPGLPPMFSIPYSVYLPIIIR
jgi:hypothetical protein